VAPTLPPPPPATAAPSATSATAEPDPTPEPQPAEAFDIVDLTDRSDHDAGPLPVAGEPTPEPAATPDDDLVSGIMCSREHFNNPSARYCMVCGISMVHLTHRLVEGRRPTLGFAVFDDGATYAFDRPYVIGREPADEADERHAEPLLLDDAERTVSRAHAELRLVGWDVVLRDLGSTNGTFVWNPPARRWDRLEPGQERRLDSGATVSIGRRTFVFESVHRTDPVASHAPAPGVST
jgi:predicted component of type VI protein secretion system